MDVSAQTLREFVATQEYFVGIDSDGCVFDTMELKHKECFIPRFIKHFGLQAVSKYAREVWEFVNLYSKTRGINRFPALSNALNLLAERPEVEARGVTVPATDALDLWLASETAYTNATLEAAIQAGQTGLQPILDWSLAVNAAIADLVHGVPPFPLVRESLERLRASADLMVISQTPTEALQREWDEHQLAPLVALIAGQELGSKTEHLKLGAGGKYAPRHVLMIGDAPGDFKAARLNHALFYPIIPGYEELSWQRFHDEALDHFLSDTYAGEYEEAVIEEFQQHLPEQPPWRG
jgi:phosphoglycolate phosphatase-like HAD superfamily hydrolase